MVCGEISEINNMEKYIPTWVEFGWNEWGYGSDSMPPEHKEMFPDPWGECKYVCNYAIEDFLQHNEIFYNLIKGTSCHMDSYMTGVNYNALDTALDILDKNYNQTKEEMQRIFDAWMSNHNTQIPARIVAGEIKHRYNLTEHP